MKTFWLDSASKKKEKKKRSIKQGGSEVSAATATLASMEKQTSLAKQQSADANPAKAEPTVPKETNNPSDKPNPSRQNSDHKSEAKKPAPEKAKN